MWYDREYCKYIEVVPTKLQSYMNEANWRTTFRLIYHAPVE